MKYFVVLVYSLFANGPYQDPEILEFDSRKEVIDYLNRKEGHTCVAVGHEEIELCNRRSIDKKKVLVFYGTKKHVVEKSVKYKVREVETYDLDIK